MIKLEKLIPEYYMQHLKEFDLQKTIYCDMDGVLTDFDKQLKSVGIKDGRAFEAKHGSEAFWNKIDSGGLKWWSEMPWMSDGKQLWNYIKDKNVQILSAPAKTLPQSKEGKKIWVKKNLGNVTLILKRAREKQQYAKPNAILIDDLDKNIKQWRASGGIGILHKSATSTLKQLQRLGI